ncbi:MAG: glycosyltransferase family 4 protein [Deltaproteobacteria bacterium]|nr:glycosyltransferase family 4 protein [Deltaproteobacteria bacterium]
MKVAVVVKDFMETRGGLERYAVSLARGLKARGAQVHVFANTGEHEEGFLFHHVPCVRRLSLLKVITFPWNAGRALRKDDYDIVYGLTPLFTQDIYRVGEGLHRDALRHRHPNLLRRFFRYLNPKHLAILWIEKRMFEGRPFVITNSEMMKERVVSLYSIEPQMVHVIYNGFDEKRFNIGAKAHRAEVRKELSIADDEPLIIFVSNDFERKGLQALFGAVSLLFRNGERIKVMVIGKGHIERFAKKAENMGLGGLVSFVGPKKDIERYYGAADMLVLPTLYDPFSNVCLEAMACGIPVITTARNGASEIITDGVDGFTLEDPNDADLLARRIVEILDVRDIGENAARKAKGFSLERNISETIVFFNEAAARKNKGYKGAHDVSKGKKGH